MHHPWRALRSLTDWSLSWARLPDFLVGTADHRSRTITLDPRQLQVERRCTVAHEVVHAERGPVPAEAWWAAREEWAVEVETARRLLPLEVVADALRWAHDVDEAADCCWVTPDVLEVRLRHLHPAERAWLRARLDDVARDVA